MKKTVIIVAAMAALSIPLFAENKVGKVTGIQVKEKEAVISIAEGLVNPFAEDGFVKSGEVSVTVPLDVAIELYLPKTGRGPGRPDSDATEAKADKEGKEREHERPCLPAMSVSQLKIDQLVQVVYEADGRTVSKIQTLPAMQGGPRPIARAWPGKPDASRFSRQDRDGGHSDERKR